MKHKIYCFNNGGSDQWYTAMAIACDGYCLASHICSHEGFMKHDLGITSNWKHDNYNKHFGEGAWELEWVPNPRPGNHAGLDEAYRLNQELGKARQESDASPEPLHGQQLVSHTPDATHSSNGQLGASSPPVSTPPVSSE